MFKRKYNFIIDEDNELEYYIVKIVNKKKITDLIQKFNEDLQQILLSEEIDNYINSDRIDDNIKCSICHIETNSEIISKFNKDSSICNKCILEKSCYP